VIVEKVLEAKARKIKQWPVNSNRASELGHECLKYLVLNRTRWEEKTLHNAKLQMIFDMGKMVEESVMQDLREAGFVIVEQQRPFSWAKYQITGSIDCKIAIDGKTYPTEIKSAAPFSFNSINSIEDMKRHKWHYMRKYPAQLTLYLLMDGKDRGLFIFKNKSTGELKEIFLDLDYDFAESLIKKAEAINKHVAEGTLPEPMEYSEEIIKNAENGWDHLRHQVNDLGTEVGKIGKEYKYKFLETINNDLNLPQALAVASEMLKSKLSDADKLATVLDFDLVLGLELAEKIPAEIMALAEEREEARIAKDWSRSDELRQIIEDQGYLLKDGPNGFTLMKK